MTPEQFREYRARFKGTDAEFGKAVGLTGKRRDRTVRRWKVKGVDGLAEKAVRVLMERLPVTKK